MQHQSHSGCLTPIHIRNEITGQVRPCPCSRCPVCKKRRASGWAYRLMQEDRVSDSSQFITLTYDTSTVPITTNGHLSLCKRDVQTFLKRLRKAANRIYPNSPSIKYYAVGEYGGHTIRPHYHLIMFNTPIDLIQNAWRQGYVYYGDVTGASVGYTLKYISKTRVIPVDDADDRQPEFSLMSKGLGSSYINDLMIGWHRADLDNRSYIPIEGGKKISMPRYYKEKIYSEMERKRIAYFFASAKELVELEKYYFDPEGVKRPVLDNIQSLKEINGVISQFKSMHFNSSKNEKL